MTDTAPSDILDFVRASARLLELPLDEAQLARVATHLARTRTMVAPLRLLPLGAELEPAEIYCPAPFPAEDPA
ncbi:DUF4089 domain-containing protein [Rhizobacter sp. OV335]|uniref:DUF4089 domain-containing protein n=1 Tax=Rhizobacter sp. OV335 TaxID=1500264 RepID=UPI00091C0344|nr:DUF4089 domain-containing protein [Rhizobacter sp. OV335]SHN23986.1 Protein of unknown function [Rhizobacter sp. OV335]